jgi:hypothetical protein
MGKHETPLQKHFSQVPQAQLVPEPPKHDQEHNVCGIFEKVEWRSCALVEHLLAIWAAECSITEDGFLRLFSDGG